MSVGTAAVGVRESPTPPSAWLAEARQALAELDDEMVEDGLPEIGPSVRREAERIIVGLARHPWAPTVYPTRDAERRHPLLDNHGRGECYAYTGGHSRRAHYGASSDLPTISSWSSCAPYGPNETATHAKWREAQPLAENRGT